MLATMTEDKGNGHRPFKVLLIEDNPGDARLIRELLGDEDPAHNYELRQVAALSEGLAAAAREPCHLMLLDLSLPDARGLEALTRLHQTFPSVPIVVLTGLDDINTAVEALQLGAQDYMVKGRVEGGLLVRAMRYAIERQDMMERLRQAQKLEAIGRLAGGLAHDFNNYMTVVSGYSSLLLDTLPPDSAIRPEIVEIQRAAQSATRLTRQLLTFSRKQLLQPRLLDLNQVVLDAHPMLHALLGDANELEIEPSTTPALVLADPDQIQQALVNLLLNARDAMQGGKGRCTVTIRHHTQDKPETELSEGHYVLLQVSDTGHGMTADVMSHLFEPFFTTKRAGKGTGLGLSTVYGIVRQSGGHIWATSQPGVGSTFTICLRSVVQAAEFPATATAEQPTLSPRGHETVLLVEDQPQVRSLLRDVLRRSGYHVVEAANGADAVAISQSWPGRLDMLVTDLVMPRMGGLQVADEVRALGHDVPVLFISGHHDDAEDISRRLNDTTAFLEKPVAPATFLETVRRLIDQKARVGL